MRYLAGLACALVSSHAAAAMLPDPTGLWYDPAESGWGLTIAQQGDTGFAVLFVYDPAGHPVWYFASDLVDPGTFGPVPGGPGLFGPLYRATGPWFGGPFDPHAVTTTSVGSLSLLYTDPGHQSLRVDYIVDGTSVTRFAVAQTWGDKGALLVGGFFGGMKIIGASPTICPDLFSGSLGRTSAGFQVSAIAPGQLRFEWGTSGDSLCRVEGQYVQHGQLGSVAGRIGCEDINGNPPPIPGPDDPQIQLSELAINEHGFSGAVTIQSGTCAYNGHIGGVRGLNPDFGGT